MHFSSFISSLVVVFLTEEEIVALSVYSPLRRVATSMLQTIPAFTAGGSQISQTECKWAVKIDWLSIQYSVTAQHSGWNGCDVTKLVASEHLRNKYSLPESLFSLISHAAISSFTNNSTIISALVTANQLNCTYQVDLYETKQMNGLI